MCWGIDSWGNSLVPKGGGALYFPSVTHANRYMTGKDQSIPSPTNKTAICMSKIETSPIYNNSGFFHDTKNGNKAVVFYSAAGDCLTRVP